MRLISWVKAHKFPVLIAAIVVYFIWNNAAVTNTLNTPGSFQTQSTDIGYSAGAPVSRFSSPSFSSKQNESYSTNQNRLVVKNSDLSLVVKDVKESSERIISHAKSLGGFMVSASYNQPTESPFATISVRVPSARLDESLKYFRSLALKVTSENLVGTDVTDQYTDIESRLATLRKTEEKFNDILQKATAVQDILTVQRELINIQDQIDSYIGQKMALEKNAELSAVTVYLSTDELALPYTPDEAFRPTLVFKQAVRSVLWTIRSGANLVIWLGVYSILWVPALAGYVWYKKRHATLKTPSN